MKISNILNKMTFLRNEIKKEEFMLKTLAMKLSDTDKVCEIVEKSQQILSLKSELQEALKEHKEILKTKYNK